MLDPKEDARLQPSVMKTDSGVDDGNYCMVYIVLSNLHLVLISKLLSSSLTTYDCSFILIGAATEAAQPKVISQYQSMSICMISSSRFTCSPLYRAVCNHFSQLCMVRKKYILKWMNWMTLITHAFFLQDPKEDVQPSVMKTESGVNDGNYCMVYMVLPNLQSYNCY